MTQIVSTRISVTWLVLMLLTCGTWWLGAGPLALVLVIVLAFAKIVLVGNEFMELRHAPVPLRAIFLAWTLLVALGASALVLL